MKIYLDTGIWIRLFETNLTQEQEKDQQAIEDILEELKNKHEIVSSRFQVRQLEALLSGSQGNKRLAVTAALAQCKYAAPSTIQSTPYHDNEFRELMQKTGLQDAEDGHHIVIAWFKGAEYFVTVDYTTILSKKNVIESTIASIIMPFPDNFKDMKVMNPKMFAGDVLQLSRWI